MIPYIPIGPVLVSSGGGGGSGLTTTQAAQLALVLAKLTAVTPAAEPVDVLPAYVSATKRRVYVDLGELAPEQIEAIEGVTIRAELVLPKWIEAVQSGSEFFIGGWGVEAVTDTGGATPGRTYFDLPITTNMMTPGTTNPSGAVYRFTVTSSGKVLRSAALPSGDSVSLTAL